MRDVVILGAGTGGALVANMLSTELDYREWQITVVDKASEHHYQPGYLFLPFGLYGYKDRDDIAKKITDPLPPFINFVNAEVKLIDHQNKKIKTDGEILKYDWLVCAMGCRIAPEEVTGLQEAMGQDVHSFYTLEAALEFQQVLDRMKTGKLAIITADMPIKCPVAPLEFAFLADYFFHRRGIREQVDITYITPLSGAFTQPNASRILQSLIDKKRITIVPNFTMEHIDAADKTVFSFEGDSVDYDLLCVVPPHLGPQVIEDSSLGDGSGYGVADRRTLKSRKADFIYFIGDNSNVTHFKTGSVAHFQARTVVDNLLREIEGKKPLASFDGHANCFMETGYEKAVLIDFNYDMEPLEGTFPLPLVGPFSLLEESYINHVGDIVFKWVYWNMLLSGCMPMVPLVPSQMDFIGKDLTQAPQLRRARALKVKDVMSKDVVTVTQGTPLTEAAQLMSRHNVSGLPVVDVDDQLIGVLTEADFLSAIDIKGDSGIKQIFDAIIKRKRTKKKMGTIVDDIMTRDPITVKEEDTLQHAIEVMGMNKIKRLIVTSNEGNICGVISRPDLIKLFLMRG